ncbi:MAG: pyridine nucleotide-disulfide oxidoreductase, partial [Bryobacteraceae bacterium]
MNRANDIQDGYSLRLSFGFNFEDLYARDGLVKLDAIFLEELRRAAPELHARLLSARQAPASLAAKQHSELIIELAPYLEDFAAQLFGIEAELRNLQERHSELAPLYSVKRRFVQRKALTGYTVERASEIDGFAVGSELEALLQEPLTEMSFANHVSRWLEAEPERAEHLQLAAQYAAWATLTPAGKARHGKGVLFKIPHKLDPYHFIPVHQTGNGLVRLELSSDHWRRREGFELTDPGTDLTGALDQAYYCIKCHNQEKDSCSTGLKEKNGAFKASVFGVTLAGCPLDEKISEMNAVKGQGNPIGALAVVVIDNPMCAGTGHRICNDC